MTSPELETELARAVDKFNLTVHKDAEPYKVKLIKGQKDTYGWEVTVTGNQPEKILDDAQKIDSKLRAIYNDRLGGN